MKKLILFYILFGFLFQACTETKSTEKPQSHKAPTERCENVSWGQFPAITHGFHTKEFDTVTIETYIKNTNFDSLVSSFKVLNDAKSYGNDAYQKGFSFPKEVTSAFDLFISIGKEKYRITDVKTDWVPRMCQSFCGYDCTITNFEVNGQRSGGNIILRNPHFESPD